MDAVSYSHSAKQAQRIEKFIENPDSISGIITVPKVIESTENITIPEGRVAILPNVQVDGTLNVVGEVFIPSGSTTTGLVEKVTSTDNAIVRFNGTTGDVQNSNVIIDDAGNITGVVSISGKSADSDKLDGLDSSVFLQKISTPTANSLVKVNADGSISNSSFTEDSSNNLVIPKAVVSGNSTNGLVNRVNVNKANYSFYSITHTFNALKLTILGNTTYMSLSLNITYMNLYAAANNAAVRQYSYKRTDHPHTVNFSEVGTGLGSSNLTHTRTTLITGGVEVVFSFPAGGFPQIDIEAINHRFQSTGSITGEFLTL